MNKSLVVPVTFLTVILPFIVLNANAEDFNVLHEQQIILVSDSKISSDTVTSTHDGGIFKDASAKGDVLALLPGDDLVCSFKLPDDASNVKATVDYYVSSDSAKGMIRLNQVLFSDENSLLKKKAQQGLSTTEILLKNAQIQNELKIFSVEGEVCIHQIKIDYDYRMPFCKNDDVTVVLTSPVANTDVLQQNMRFEWKIKGDFKNGWITLKYQKQDNGLWETVPGAELLDCQATQKGGDYGEFFWNNHGLSAIPKLQIEYHNYKNYQLPSHFSREMRPFVLDNAESVDAYMLLAKRFLEEDKELAKTIVLKRHEITVFKPTKKTLKEIELEHNIDIPRLDDPIINTFIYNPALIKEYKLNYRIAKRRDEDFKVDFGLLNLAAIEKGLLFFDTLDNSAAILKEHIQKRAAQENSSAQKEKLASILPDIAEFQSNVKNDKKTFLSYSVVSPYLAAADRSLTWDYPKSESSDAKKETKPLVSSVYAANLNFSLELPVSYDTYLAIVCYMNQNGWIKECNEDVKKQFTELQDKHPIVKTRIKDKVTKEFVMEHDKKLQKSADKKQGDAEK